MIRWAALRRRFAPPSTGGLGLRSIRVRIVVAFGALLALGTLNVAVFYIGATRRAEVFEELQRAIRRQTMILETMHELEQQTRQVKLLTEVIGVEGPPPPEAERESFARRVDAIPRQLEQMLEISAPDGRPALRDLLRRSRRLVASWKAFNANRGVDPVRAIQEVVQTAEPLAFELINRDFPAAVAREKERLGQASDAFVRMDRMSSRSTWIIFLVSTLLGGFLAITISRDLLRSIEALRLGAEKIGQGDLRHRIPVRRRDELADVADSFNVMAERLRERTSEIEEERKVSESLLLNILPRQIAVELRKKGRVDARYLPDTTIMFADFVGFTHLFETLSTDRMVRLLDQMFTDFDRIVRTYGLEKLKTIGDAYMCAGGLSREGTSHPIDAVMAAFDFVDAVERRADAERLPLAIRIGIHTGPVATGVVGIDKFAFDVWGETVNFAARLEETSEPNCVNISSGMYARVKDFFSCEYRGRIETKERRTFDMYFVRGVHPEIAGSGSPPPGFSERYQAYFERAPTGYPRGLVRA
ncbi:MAG TPA: adenylate/guanylate cyclase domain-containing protein [Longimicrobiales bacterium]